MQPRLTLAALASLALGAACVEPPDHSASDVDATDADAAGDSANEDGDASPTPTTPSPPTFAELRQRPFLWLRSLVLEADGRHFATVVEDHAVGPDEAPAWRLARVDATTLEVVPGPAIDPSTVTLEASPSRVAGTLWLFGEGGPRLRALELATQTLGPALALPPHALLHRVAWTADQAGLALPWGDERWEAVTVLTLPSDPTALTEETAAARDIPLGATDNLHLRLTAGGRFLVVGDAPDKPEDPGCSLCFPEVDEAAGRFRVFDLAATDPTAPVVSETGRYEDDFRVTELGRWLLRGGDAGVVATDLLDPLHPSRHLECEAVGAMILREDGGIICAGPSAAGERLQWLDADLEVVARAPLASAAEALFPSPEGARVLVGDEVVDLAADPPTTTHISWPPLAERSFRLGDGGYVWVVPNQEHHDLVRLRWEDLHVESLPVDGNLVLELEALADGGLALVRYPAWEDIEIYRADGVLRGVLHRRASTE